MNELFVCVKVDREERPDVDHFYMDAVQLLFGHGGWPLNCFATPDGKPFWGGTYFKPEQWKEILRNVSGLYRSQQRDFLEQANEVTEHLMKSSYVNSKAEQRILDESYYEEVLYLLRQHFDARNGGLQGAPKFPMPLMVQLLLHYYYAFGKQDIYQHAMLTLRNMAKGGIYDQLGGGFARYSVDNHWKVPHFEKMLYDNALLVSLYCNAYRITRDESFREVVKGTLDFVKRELSSPEGLFYSSLDADSDGEEGNFYTWKKSELDEVLGQYSNLIAEYFGMGNAGAWAERKCILHRPEDDTSFARNHYLSEAELQSLLVTCRSLMMEARNKRTRPGLDDKVLVSWNALMIKAYADAYATFGESEYLGIALNAARKLMSLLHDPDGGLFHTWKNGKARISGFLDDYTFMADACLAIYQQTLDNTWLSEAESLVKYAITRFAEPESGLFFFSEQKHKCIVRKTETYDSVIPSSNSSFARLLHAMGTLTGKNSYVELCDRMLSVMIDKINNYPTSYANWMILAMERSLPYFVITVVGENAHEKLQEFGKNYIPFTLLAGSTMPGEMPSIRNRYVPGKTLIHICNENSCFAPVDSVEKALDLLKISVKLVE
jgi:uncharacterized protein YyaL (SSP411 family)